LGVDLPYGDRVVNGAGAAKAERGKAERGKADSGKTDSGTGESGKGDSAQAEKPARGAAGGKARKAS
jgi:hypothetical protein